MRLSQPFERAISVVLAVAVAISAAQASIAREPPAEVIISGTNIYPESLTSTRDGRLLIGSIGKHAIYMANAGAATAQLWIAPDVDARLGIFGVFADDNAHLLWACLTAVLGAHGSAEPRSELLAFDLNTGKLRSRYPLPTQGAFCNDIAIGSDGAAYVTDSVNMQVDRLKNGAHELHVWAGKDGFGPSDGFIDGIAVLENRVFINAYRSNKIFVVPIAAGGKAGEITELQLDRPLDHPDGMRSFEGRGLLVVEGGGGGRLSLLSINGKQGNFTTLKEGFADGPVAVTVVGRTGYVLEGQLSRLFHPDALDLPPHAFHATAVNVGAGLSTRD